MVRAGSVPLTHRSVELSVNVDWSRAATSLEDVMLKSYEQSNPTEEFVVPKWKIVEALEVGMDHR